MIACSAAGADRAEAALRRFRAETTTPVVALHWRGDEDFVRTAHGSTRSQDDALARRGADAAFLRARRR
ncbi:hypothetical protein JL721_12698 [Aureococcus anophagefferens]|nr:hypothetical protein JL721_12698 [Aureococcus anophagefferens]